MVRRQDLYRQLCGLSHQTTVAFRVLVSDAYVLCIIQSSLLRLPYYNTLVDRLLHNGYLASQVRMKEGLKGGAMSDQGERSTIIIDGLL